MALNIKLGILNNGVLTKTDLFGIEDMKTKMRLLGASDEKLSVNGSELDNMLVSNDNFSSALHISNCDKLYISSEQANRDTVEFNGTSVETLIVENCDTVVTNGRCYDIEKIYLWGVNQIEIKSMLLQLDIRRGIDTVIKIDDSIEYGIYSIRNSYYDKGSNDSKIIVRYRDKECSTISYSGMIVIAAEGEMAVLRSTVTKNKYRLAEGSLDTLFKATGKVINKSSAGFFVAGAFYYAINLPWIAENERDFEVESIGNN